MKHTDAVSNNRITDSEVKNSNAKNTVQSLTSILSQQQLEYKLSPSPSIDY